MAGMITRDTLWEPVLASWLLAMKSDDGKSATFSHWPRLDTVFVTQACISLRALVGCQGLQEGIFKG